MRRIIVAVCGLLLACTSPAACFAEETSVQESLWDIFEETVHSDAGSETAEQDPSWDLTFGLSADVSNLPAEENAVFTDVSIGDTIAFGRFEQDNDISNGPEKIEWIVLNQDGDTFLVISKYVLDCQRYNQAWEDVNYLTCSLGTWLNGPFLENAFTEAEQAEIIYQHPRSRYRILLLTVDEMDKYFADNEKRVCMPTTYAAANGSLTGGSAEACSYWLRDVGKDDGSAAYVRSYGEINDSGTYVDTKNIGVRPAFWMHLNSGSFELVEKNAKPVGDSVIPVNVWAGDTITFGRYEQDNDPSNGPEEIEWTLLKKEEDRALVISNYALDCQPYNTVRANVTWSTCSLRTWLNTDFLNAAFTEVERARIPSAYVLPAGNKILHTDPGEATQDRIFILGIDQATEYYGPTTERWCSLTAYAAAKGAYVGMNHGDCNYWLRSPGRDGTRASNVYNQGSVNFEGFYVDAQDVCVRPVMWIDLNP